LHRVEWYTGVRLRKLEGGASAVPEYLSYLLRLRRVEDERTPLWRASLQRPGTLETIDLVDLEALLAFLRAEMGEGVAPGPVEREQAPPCPESRPWAVEMDQRTSLVNGSRRERL
jgi:hypothetical protein